MSEQRTDSETYQGQNAVTASKRAPVLMLQGTASDVGKSLLTAALCRFFANEGLRVAPFKSQNMSLNSYVTPDGKEIGRAQGMQADACRTAATTDMNPILLKPKKDMISQVVVHGKPYKDLDARTYREKYLPEAEQVVKEALERLRESYDLVLIEGAGSPAEINLKDRDIVNMRLAGWADAPVMLVSDIDRGGVFASIVGTLEILTPEERDRVKGFIINKFRGDVSLLQPGIEWLEQKTGKPVLGVIPYLPGLALEDEDSASLDQKLEQAPPLREGQLDIAVVRLPRISNFTDFDALADEADVRLRYVSSAKDWGAPDAVLLPGSKNTVDDLLYIREAGLEPLLKEHAARGGALVGICAGYQMLGQELHDPEHLESDRTHTEGLGFFPTVTTFTPDKRTVRVCGTTLSSWGEGMDLPVSGYEIHMGRTQFTAPVRRLFQIAPEFPENNDAPPDPVEEGAVTAEGNVWGTYIHGILDNDALRREWLNRVRIKKGWRKEESAEGLGYRAKREQQFDRLAEHVAKYLDMDKVRKLIHT
ncbi:cobyric acid synthase [Paenibacillus turpanensis]|uniref:cobyric acid synthase n=1 Tax=Paenibacillus turpanensis TaxID=2689078 RepID=UPI00140E6871|nr:cobyric acid synthase [Paenibacillus turpanensis]